MTYLTSDTVELIGHLRERGLLRLLVFALYFIAHLPLRSVLHFTCLHLNVGCMKYQTGPETRANMRYKHRPVYSGDIPTGSS